MENNDRKQQEDSVFRGPPPPYTEYHTLGSTPISVTANFGLPQLPPSYSEIGSSIVLQPLSPSYNVVPFVAQPPGKRINLS